jgi:xanthine/CO dehydrogenase XdhC/CoxF family maturation factor
VIEIFVNPEPQSHLEAIESTIQSRKKREFTLDLPDGSVFVETLEPTRRLVIFGAGHDSVPLSKMASILGWEVSVVDCRSSFPTPAGLFNSVDFFVRSEPDQVLTKTYLDEDTLVVTMTHNYEHDRSILKQILTKTQPAYLGMLGPKSRSERLLESLEAEGLKIDRRLLRFPAGLDIGGNHPEAIALSILAEIQCVLSNRAGGALRERAAPIHSEPSDAR